MRAVCRGVVCFFFFSSRRRHTRFDCDWSSDVCSSDLTVADGGATRAAETPAGLRSAPVLSPGQAGELARVGLAIEELYGEPVDVEWAHAPVELSVVRARPITALASCSAYRPIVST